MRKRLVFLSFVFFLGSCSSKKTFKKSVTFAGNKTVSAETLNLGEEVYSDYCMSCHGVNGDGKGVASKGMIPPPRNFKQGQYKFTQVVSGELPHDKHLEHIITQGLNGTAMFKWNLQGKQLNAVVQYIKTFAMDTWGDPTEKLGKEIDASKDPYDVALKDFAIAKGKKIYHQKAQCFTCHRGYASSIEMAKWAKEVGESFDGLDDDFYELKIQEGDYGYPILPPDFTKHPLRSIHNGVKDTFVRLKSGIYGSGMPAWGDTLTDAEIWAVSYFIDDLAVSYKSDSKKRREFLVNLK